MMLQELDTPFFFTCSHHAGVLHCESPPLSTIASAILNAGYKVSPTHALPGSIKTDAPQDFIWDAFRHWSFSRNQNSHLAKWPETSAANRILSKPALHEMSFAHHPDSEITATKAKKKLPKELQSKAVRYPSNPPNWGPKARAKAVPLKTPKAK